jgi:hypothetical protein
MDSGKLPKFTGERRDFDVWKKLRFRAFGLMQNWAPALSSDGGASSQQLVDMYSTLILALPEDDLSIIENVSEDDKTAATLRGPRYSIIIWTMVFTSVRSYCKTRTRRKRTARGAFNT